MKLPASASVVVLNWNGKHLLEECLPSVVEAARAYPGACEVIVVDNGSTDDSVPFLEEEFPAVKLVLESRQSMTHSAGAEMNRAL